MSDASDHQRCEVLFRGRVQGVGFRYTTLNVARSFEITGYVQNLPSGDVRLVAEGSPSELKRFVSAVEEAMRGFIEDSRIEKSDYTGEFEDFKVRH